MSSRFFTNEDEIKLREFLTENLTLHTLIDFRDAPIFNGVIAYASILVGRNQPAPYGHQADALPWDQTKKAAELPIEIRNTFPVRQQALTLDGWRLVAPEVEALLAKLREKGTPLGEYVEGRFYYGIKTGLNEALVIDGKKRAQLIAADPNCEAIIKPFLRGRDVKRWKATHQDLWLIKIESSANEKHPWTGTEDPEAVFRSTYPSIHSWFEGFRDRLIKRDDQGVHFWELRSCVYWQEFEKPKILIPAISDRANISADRASFLINNKGTIAVSDDSEFLMCVCNSNTSHFLMQLCFAEKQNNSYDFEPRYSGQFPIPPADDADKTRLADLAERCAEAAAKGDQATVTAHEAEINRIVYRLFDLTEAEIALIESTLVN